MTLNRQGLRFSSTWPAGHNSTRTGSNEQKQTVRAQSVDSASTNYVALLGAERVICPAL
jgi:hypothetical protein